MGDYLLSPKDYSATQVSNIEFSKSLHTILIP